MEHPSLRGERPRTPRVSYSGGFTYIGLLIAITILGIMLSAAGTMWSIASRREKEVELLFIGHEFRNAIQRYYAAGGIFPRELADLVNDERSAVPRHFLRQIYRDPMTGHADWLVIPSPDGGVMGIASNSQATTIKRANFDPVDVGFDGIEHYSDWQFTYSPRRGRGRPQTYH